MTPPANPLPRTCISLVPRRIHRLAAAAILAIASIPVFCSAQTTILPTQPGGGPLPAGWTGENNVATNLIDRTTYWLVDAGAPGDTITTSNFDLSAFSSATIEVNVATFGNGSNNALRIEVSTDSGTTWSPTTFTTATPSSSTYIAGGPVEIAATFTATTRFRFSANGPSGRGVRIQQLGITALPSGPDTTAPTVATYSPAPAATGVAVGSNLTLTFSEPVTALTGNLTLNDGVTPAISIPVNSDQVTVAGNIVTINPTADLTVGTSYHVLIDANTFQDAAENKYVGLSDPATWTFTTVGPDVTGPAVVSVLPANGASNVDPAVTPVINYDENLLVGTGNILIKNAETNGVVATLSVTDESQVLAFNNQAFLTLPAPLPTDSEFYVEIPAGAFTDALGNPSPAYGGSGVWGFSTPIIPALTSEGPYTQNFANFTSETNLTSVASLLPDGWSVTGPDLTYDGNWGTGTTGGFRGGNSLLGFQHTGGTGVLLQTLTLINDTGATLTDLTISYVGRDAGPAPTTGRHPMFNVSLGDTPIPALSYSTISGDGVLRSASVSSLSIANGSTFSITWSSDGPNAPGSGSRRQIGISNVSVSVGAATFPPSIAAVTPDFTALTQNTAGFASEVTTDGGSPVTARGFVISPALEIPAPEIGVEGVSNLTAETAEIGPFNLGVMGLLPSTQYAVRAYATNAQGTSYSATVNLFTLATPPALVDSYYQGFNGFNGTILNGTLPAGWKVVSSGGINGFAGNWGPTTSSGGLLGNVSDPGVLGYQHVGSSGIVTASLTLTNNTGGTLEQLYVSYLGRAERVTQTRTPEWTVSLNGTPVAELAYSTAPGVDEQKTHLITGLSISPGDSFTLSWSSDADLPEGGGTRRQIGIANVLVATEAPVGLSYLAWSAANAGGADPDLDSDGDGVRNGVEYFMGESGSSFTPNPQPDATGLVTWPRDPNATQADFVVRSSTNLDQWTDILPGDPNLTITPTSVSYRLSKVGGPFFIRLEVNIPVFD